MIQKLRLLYAYLRASGKSQTSSGKPLSLTWHSLNTSRDPLGFVARKLHAVGVGKVLEAAQDIPLLLTTGTLEVPCRAFAG